MMSEKINKKLKTKPEQPKKEKRKANYGILKNNFYFFKLMLKLSPVRVIMAIIRNSMGHFTWMWSSLVVTKVVFTALDNGTSFMELLPFLIINIGIYLAEIIFTSWYNNRYIPMSNEKINVKFMRLMYDKTCNVELACFENTEFFNKYTLAISEVNDRFNNILYSFIGIVVASASVGYVYTTLGAMDPYLLLFALCPIIGSLVVGKFLAKIGFLRHRELNPYERKKDYVSRVMYLNSYSKEMKMSNAYSVLEEKYDEAVKGIKKTMGKYAPKSVLLSQISGTFNFTLMFQGIMLYTAFRAMISQTLTVVDFGIVAGAMGAASWTLIDLSNSINKMIENGFFIDNLRSFLDYTPKIPENTDGTIPQKEIESIEFKNVSFTYPDAKNPVFENLSLKINSKEKIVVVGLNGAGKSTFTKLLMRFYDPTEGEIFVNGINIKDYNLKEYRHLFRVAFQDYQLFSMSVLSNVIMKTNENDNDKTAALAALAASGIAQRINALPSGPDTTVTKEFDEEGAVFSGGEGQKLVISRAFFDNSSICVFDEPSSALDAVAESKLYDEMSKVTKDKIVLFISHRLSAAVHSDKVMLIDGKEVKEFGTHDELLAQKGLYYEMFNMQAEKYREQIDWSQEAEYEAKNN